MTYMPSAHPGCRAPHLWLEPGKSTLDLFGRDFVLLDAEDLPAEAKALFERRFVFVRPDGHVAWRGDSAPSSDVVAQVRGF